MNDLVFGDRGPTVNDVSGSVAGHVVQARSIGEIHFNHWARESESVVPSQLPMAPTAFTGRTAELDTLGRLREAKRHRPLVVVLTGPAGVGKTSLALHWLHLLREHYPDGQLFAQIGGDGLAAPTAPTDVLGWFLAALGVTAQRIPVEPAQRQALFRSVTAPRRIAVLIEDAASAAQVRPLVPAGAGSVAVVTSRSRLSGLVMDGATWVLVEPLDRPQSLQLLQARLGAQRVHDEAEAAGELADLCGGLPLALCVVSGRLTTRPRRTLAREVADLRVEGRRLPALSLDGVSVKAVLDSSYDGLDEHARLLYRRCAVHPGRAFGVEAAAAVLGSTVEHTEAVLEHLLAANLLVELGDSRFAQHELLRLHAAQRGEIEDCVADRGAALDRVIVWYLDRCVIADIVIHPHRRRLGPRYAAAPSSSPFTGERDALVWLELERNNCDSILRAAYDAGRHDLVWQLCESLWGFFLHTRHYGPWIRMQLLGVDSAMRCGNQLAEARIRSQLAFAYAKMDRLTEAAAESRTVLRLARAADDDHTAASALSQLGRVARGTGDLPGALEYFRESRDIQSRLRRWRGVALSRRRIGAVLCGLSRFDEAIGELRAAAECMAELGDVTQHARTLTFLGTTQLRAGRPDQATAALSDALDLMRSIGSPYYQAEILARLGEVAEASGAVQAARAHYGEAAELYATAGDPRADAVRSRLAALGPG